MSADLTFTVHRLNWRAHDGNWYRLPGSTPLRTFDDPEAAAARARDHEWGYRRALNPFRCGGPWVQYQTHLDAPRLYDWLLDHGLEPPGISADSGVWAAWWHAEANRLTMREREAVWAALDRVRFADVRRGEPGRTVHLVGLPALEEDPVSDLPFGEKVSYVGTHPYMVTGRRATADAVCAELLRARMAGDGHHFDPAVVTGGWERSGGRRPIDGWRWEGHGGQPTDYVERLPCTYLGPDPWPGQTLYGVLRFHWRLDPAGENWRWHRTRANSTGTPVAIYETLAAADAAQAECEAEARTDLASPFRFGSVLEWTTLHASEVWGELSKLAPIDFTGRWSDYWAADRLWSQWWDRTFPGLTPDQSETVWELFDKLRFYEVVAVEYRE